MNQYSLGAKATSSSILFKIKKNMGLTKVFLTQVAHEIFSERLVRISNKNTKFSQTEIPF